VRKKLMHVMMSVMRMMDTR